MTDDHHWEPLDIDAFLDSLGPEFADPGPDPFGGGNLAAVVDDPDAAC